MRSFTSSMSASVSAAVAVLPGLSSGQSTTAGNATTIEPCYKLAYYASKNVVNFRQSDALACLQSIPIDLQVALTQVKGLQFFVQFQSDLAYLKEPPPGFLYPAVDILGSLDQITTDIQSGHYTNDFDVQIELFDLNALVSVSSDGTSLPSVYDYSDISAIGNLSYHYTPSSVVEINGVGVEEWLNEFAALNPWDHDPDANYNNVMVSVPAQVGGNQGGLGAYQIAPVYQGDYTNITFANGTRSNLGNYATTTCQSFAGVTDRTSFYQNCIANPVGLNGTQTNSSAPTATSLMPDSYTPVPAETAAPAPPTYPDPWIISSDNKIAGHFPLDHLDLAVLAVPSFDPADEIEFQNVLRSFLATATAAKRTKLMLDIRGNGGGTVMDGYDMFKQLFPGIAPLGSSNLAATDVINAIGQVVTKFVAEGSISESETRPLFDFNAPADLTLQLNQYPSWPAFFGPVEHHGGKFTNLKRYNLSDPDALGGPIEGYINDTSAQPQSFDANSIVILSGGFCGSTCAIFAEFMKVQAGVEAIAVGGRKQYGPMQWVGGTKGSNDQQMNYLAQAAASGYQNATAEQRALFFESGGTFAELNASVTEALRRIPDPSQGRVNWENNVREGDESVTPLQFVYEAADCRFFYTANMLLDQRFTWNRAYQIKWGNGTCVQGSTGQPSSVSGNSTQYFESPPPAGASITFGANETFSPPGMYPTTTSSVAGSVSTALPGPSSTQRIQPYTDAGCISTPGNVFAILAIVVAGVFHTI